MVGSGMYLRATSVPIGEEIRRIRMDEKKSNRIVPVLTMGIALVFASIIMVGKLCSCKPLFFPIVSLLLGFFLIYRLRLYLISKHINEYRSNKIWLFSAVLLFIWFVGVYIYYVALYESNHGDISSWELIARSTTRSTLMFVSGADSNVLSDIHNIPDKNLAACLAVTAACAVVCTFVFLIAIFFSRMGYYLKLSFHAMLGEKNKLFIFFGFNKQNISLANSINNELGGKSYRIVFVEKQLSDIEDETSGWKSILSMFTHRAETFRNARKLHADFAVMNDTFTAELVNTQCNAEDDMLCKLGLKSVKRLIGRMKNGTEIHIFCLADNEKRIENIFATTVLQKDQTLRTYAQQEGSKAVIYCLARYNSVNRVMEDIDTTSRVEVKIVDPSHLSIELLKREVIHQPVSFVDIDSINNPGTVSSPFNSLVIGFSETGKDAVRFLYEFGAFVDSNSTEVKTMRSPFHCHVVDNRMNTLKGPFVNAAPAVFGNINENTGQPLIELHNMEYNSDDFFNDLLPKLAPQLNCVVIAIGDDEAGMTLAVRILKYMMRTERFQNHRFRHFRIYVRSYEPELYSHLERIANHYNRGEERIHVFGKLEEIFSYGLIVKDEFEEKGKNYYEAYRDLSDPTDHKTWEQRRDKILKKKTTLLEQLQEIRRKQCDFAEFRQTRSGLWLSQGFSERYRTI